MIGSGTLELGARGVAEKRLFAEDHRIHESGFGSGPELVNLADDAGVDARAPRSDAIAGEAGQTLDIRRGSGAEHVDAVVAKIAFIVEGSGIAEVARWMKLG